MPAQPILVLLLGDQLPLGGQLGVIGVLLVGFGVIGQWLLRQVDKANAGKDALYERVIDKVMPALEENASASRDQIKATSELVSLVAELRAALTAERDLRIRAEERLGR